MKNNKINNAIIINIFFLVLFAGACDQQKQQNEKKNDSQYESISPDTISATFNDFINALDNINLPCTLSTEQFDISGYNIPDRTKFSGHFEEGGTPLGKFISCDSLIAILYVFPADVLLPVVYTYTNDGNLKTSIKLWNNYGWDPECQMSDFTVIYPDYTIFSIDSIRYVAYPDSLKTETQQFKLCL